MTNPTSTTDNSFELAQLAATIADSKKATDVTVLQTGPVSFMAEYFVICSGESSTQIKTIATEIEKQFKDKSLLPIGKEKDGSNRWILMDFGDVIVHVMGSEEREFYQLEKFWSHATPVAKEKWLQKAELLAS